MGYGYRFGEVPLPIFTHENVKVGTKVLDHGNPPDILRRPPVLRSLGPHTVGVAQPHPDPVDPDTMKAGVLKRFCFRPPAADTALRRRLKIFVKKWIRKNLVPLSPDSDVTVENWLEHTNYPAHRKEELRTKWGKVNSIRENGGKYFKCKSFMKDETYPDYKHARGINSRSDEFKCFSGPIFKLIEEAVYRHPAFIKHIPIADRPKYIRDMVYRVGAKYVATDYTAFESLFTKEMMEDVEFQLYKYMTNFLPNGPEWFKIIAEVLSGLNICQFKHFTVECPATRMSGEMCTSLGNGFSNLMFMLFLCEELGSTCVGCVEGDDGIFRIEGEIPSSEMFARLGLVIKLEVVNDICAASFCGWIFDPEECINITNAVAVLTTFGWTTNRYARSKSKTLKLLLRCKSLSFAHQYPGCPIIQSLASYGLRMTKSFDVRGFARERWMTNQWERDQLLSVIDKPTPFREVGIKTRLLMEQSFGIPVETQLSIENYLDNLQSLTPLDLPMVVSMAPRAWTDYWSKYVMVGKDKMEQRPWWNKLAEYSFDLPKSVK